MTGPRLVVSLFGQGRRRWHVLGPVLVAGRGRGREGVGREGLLAAVTAKALPVAQSSTRLLPSGDQCPTESCTDPSETRAAGLSAAFGEAREKPPGLQLDLQEVAGSCAELIPVAFAGRGDVRASRDQAHRP